MRGNRLERYLASGLNKVEGWLESYSAEFIATLSEVQRRAGYVGSVGEIGVHHGKLFIILLLTVSEGERAVAIDIFEQQHLNVDHSGKGDRAIFLANVERWVGGDAQVQVMAKSSLEVRQEEVLARCGKLRLISVDGGHTEACAAHDLALAEAILHPYGVAVVDDYFNPCWPDVSTGVAKYLSSPGSNLRPFAISASKVYLCAPTYATFYQSEIRKHFARSKQSQMFGHAVDLYGTHSINQEVPVVSDFVKRIRESWFGPPLVSVRASLRKMRGAEVRPAAAAGWRYRIS